MAGFEFRETMAGSYHLTQAPDRERPMAFTVRARTRGLVSFLRTPVADIEGEVDAEGFADHRPLRGTLLLSALRRRTLEYAFEFTSNDGRACAFEGKKTLADSSLVDAMTVLPGVLVERGGAEIGRALLRFDLRGQLLRFLRSFRPTV